MKNILFISICCVLLSPLSYAEDTEKINDNNNEELAEEQTPPTYMECVEFIQTSLLNEQQDIQEQANIKDLPVTVETKKLDIQALNPRINPKSDDVKASLEINLPPKNDKEEADNSLSSSCQQLYGLN